ncbi:MAG: hypothetical protein EOO70_03070 [Myxococcaceae bacterium]|nr:MAG: hypothetical protein EOO70_03070 [Myxococcaceae bacterium]
MASLRLFSAQELTWALIQHSAHHQGKSSHVSFGLRGLPYGYLKVFGPSAPSLRPGSCYLAIELYNGAITMKEALAPHLNADPRPAEGPHITTHPLGTSAGPNFGAFSWGLTPSQLAARYNSAEDVVRAVVEAFELAGLPW